MLKTLSMNVKNLAIDVLGILLFISCILVTLFYHDTWEAKNQVFFHFPLVVLIFAVFIPVISIFKAGVLAWISFFFAEFGLIDEKLHHLLVQSGLYPQFASQAGFVNPQYTKLILYAVFLLIMTAILCFKRKRTPGRSFSFISALGCFAATLLIHQAIPFGTLKWERDLALKNMSSLVKYAENLKAPELSGLCRSFELTCYMDINLESAKSMLPVQSIQLEHYLKSNLRAGIFESGIFHDVTWYRQTFGFIKTENNQFHLLIEDKLINQSQKISEEQFSRLDSFANLAWGWLFLLVGLLHTSPIRKKIFHSEN